MMASSSSSTTGVPPGFRFHPTDEELLLYYLKKKISYDKFDIEVIREVDLNKIEPWDLQERCSIGSTPQNEWYFFSHKDRKYPTGSRTNRATTAGFWKATGRDKCIRTSYQKIGMRKTLVFYRGRAPHGQKTDWIMHEYRLEESDEEALGGGTEDGWVVCRVFKKKCFFKIGGSQENTSHGMENHMNTSGGHDQSRVYSSQYMLQHPHLLHHQNASLYGKPELGLHYPLMQAPSYSHVQVQDLLPNHRSGGYDFSLLPSDSAAMSKPYQACDGALEVEACQQIQQEGREGQNDWGMLDNIEGRFGGAGAQMDQMSKQQRGGEIDLWGYGK